MEHPKLVKGQAVLEIGSGTGLCGIVAAKLGASQVQGCPAVNGYAENSLACNSIVWQ